MIQTTMAIYDTHRTQRERIISLFKVRGFCYTQELVGLGIYQYNARIKELRTAGFEITSKKMNGKYAFVLETGDYNGL